jgi:hypothetical protein
VIHFFFGDNQEERDRAPGILEAAIGEVESGKKC